MGPGFRRESGSRSCQFLISIWIFAQPLAEFLHAAGSLHANVEIVEGQHRAHDTKKIRGRAWHPRAQGAPTDDTP